MRMIRKYELPFVSGIGAVNIQVHRGFRVLTVQELGGKVALWLLEDVLQPEQLVPVYQVATGVPLPDDIIAGGYLGTISVRVDPSQSDSGWWVTHVFRAVAVDVHLGQMLEGNVPR